MLRVQDCSKSSKDYQKKVTSDQVIEALEMIKKARSFILISINEDDQEVCAVSLAQNIYDVIPLTEASKEIITALADGALKSLREEKSK